jgi:hypothetical protein
MNKEIKFDGTKERVIYLKTESGGFAAKSIGLNCACEGKTLMEVKIRMKAMIKSLLNYYDNLLETDEPFEFEEIETLEEFLTR